MGIVVAFGEEAAQRGAAQVEMTMWVAGNAPSGERVTEEAVGRRVLPNCPWFRGGDPRTLEAWKRGHSAQEV